MTNKNLPVLEKNYQYGENIDKCIAGLVVKTGAGVVIGGLFSLLFSRKRWPVTLGAGIGIGMAYTACEHRFQHSANALPQDNRVQKVSKVKFEAPVESSTVLQENLNIDVEPTASTSDQDS